MVARSVEWVLVVYYGPSAHRATYGRLDGSNTKYTKDYIQLSRKKEFLDVVSGLFPVDSSGEGSVPLTYKWPKGSAPGELVFQSADRPHLKWETSQGAPKAWKMSLTPSETTDETIPGDPTHLDFSAAEKEFALLASRGAGQPYLLAVKLRDQARTLHLRVYLAEPSQAYEWADIANLPESIQDLAAKTSQKSALAWSTVQSGGVPPSAAILKVLSKLAMSENMLSVIDSLDQDANHALLTYLKLPGYGLFFDPDRNHNAWLEPAPFASQLAGSVDHLLGALEARFPANSHDDVAAELLEVDLGEVEVLREKIKQKNYEVADSTATVKTRGSAQRAFSEEVKANYSYRCAITGIEAKDFLVASHIVPWSKDQTIRLDPSNGICLSLLVDRAFERGYLLIEDDLTIRIDHDRVVADKVLSTHLQPYHGKKMTAPSKDAPQPTYLLRRRNLVGSSD